MDNEELVRLYQEGDKQALNTLIEQNMGIVRTIALKYNNLNPILELDDLIQSGYVGFVRAADNYKFDTDHPTSFMTFAYTLMKQEILSLVNGRTSKDKGNNKFYNECKSLNSTLKDDDELELIDTIGDMDNNYENVEERIYIKQLRKDLEYVMDEVNTLREKEVLKLHYGWDCKSCSYAEIGEIFDVTRERIRQIINNAYIKIRRSRQGRELKLKYAEELILYTGHNTFKEVERRIDFEAERRKIEEQLRESERMLAMYEKCLDI